MTLINHSEQPHSNCSPRVIQQALQPGLVLALLLALLLAGAGCDRNGATQGQTESRKAESQAATPEASVQPKAAPLAQTPVILFLGDSLTAGHGLAEGMSFPDRIRDRLGEAGYPHRVINAGISGDTTAGGLNRLDWVLGQRVDIMVLELGANDGLRGQDPESARNNLAAIIEQAQGKGITVLLAGMRMPLNYGRPYRKQFEQVFADLAKKYSLPFLPFLLEGVASNPDLNLPDGIHPNEAGTEKVAQNVWRVLEPLLQ